jgi:outer membrane lipoprotein LolB
VIAAARAVAALLLAGVLLAGCVAPGPRATTGAVLSPAEARAWLTTVDRFALQGRLAAAVSGEGFSSNLAWVQDGAASRVDLRAPLGFGSVTLRRDGDALSYESSRGERLDGDAARDALGRVLGFDPPLANLPWWVRGLPGPGSPATETAGPDGRLASLEQDGWRLTYDEYRESAAGPRRALLPYRLTLTRDAVRLRLLVNRWERIGR